MEDARGLPGVRSASECRGRITWRIVPEDKPSEAKRKVATESYCGKVSPPLLFPFVALTHQRHFTQTKPVPFCGSCAYSGNLDRPARKVQCLVSVDHGLE